jgi:hypothetical protein
MDPVGLRDRVDARAELFLRVRYLVFPEDFHISGSPET